MRRFYGESKCGPVNLIFIHAWPHPPPTHAPRVIHDDRAEVLGGGRQDLVDCCVILDVSLTPSLPFLSIYRSRAAESRQSSYNGTTEVKRPIENCFDPIKD